MCYSAGSITQSVNPCPMCKVYPHPKCPHIRETCRNRAAHPRMDVLYLTNAEVDRFNGCGFCKWASIDPPAQAKGYANPGWPGCCRPPKPAEYPTIQIAEWKAVGIVHNIPIPPEVERVLAAIHLPPSRPPSTQPTSPTARSPTSKTASSNTSRRSSNASTPVKATASKPINTPSPQHRGRNLHASGSPNANFPRTPSSAAISSSVPNSSSMDSVSARRKASATPDRRIEGTQSSHSSPSRKSVDLDSPNSTSASPRTPSGRRPALTPATTSVSVSKIVAADTRAPRDVSLKRRSLISDAPVVTSSPPSTPSETTRKESFLLPRSPRDELSSSASSSSGSSDGRGSITDSTVTSDGGFTDYLSDESEAELQRQAEARAVVLAQNQAEELEFKLARQQLASVGLKPPKSWNPTNSTPPRAPASAGVPRNGGIGSPATSSFAGAATAMLHSGQAARG
ncbi:hypothetical protein BDN70DRAFT_991141 [Pholiota conissans]|uniref:Uncharacterized protein n=1 Tax=Pholiota conissans TaxID=109636 RepID=A0A9P6D4C6_9AGAR|nr:hypothetical protein BDN70DRAFT_991141 [Pholiota conissans]